MAGENQVVVAQPLKRVESFLKDYKPLTEEDKRNVQRKTYDEFLKDLRSDPVKVMVQASDWGMDLSQYGNFISPDTLVQQNRSIIHRVMQDEGIYVNHSDVSAPSTVAECMDGAQRQAVLFHVLTKAWNNNSIQDRNSITLPTSAPLNTPPNTAAVARPPQVAVGVRLNPGELVAITHSVDTNNYNPFKWDYDKGDMARNKVKPAQTIPPSTLAEEGGNIPMSKWGNRFVIPYEMLTGGQGMRVNKLAQMVSLDASAESARQYAELLGVCEKGDGVSGAATSEGISGYGGTANEFDFTAFLNWLDEALEAPFQISHVIMLKAQQRQLRAGLSALQGNQAFEQLSSVGLAPSSMSNMETQGNVRYGRAPEGAITAGKVIGLDARQAVERVDRAGMTIREQAQNIANQTQDVVISDTYLWARLAKEAVKVLDITS